MRRVEAGRDLLDELDRAPRLEPAFAPEQLAQVGALDVCHREVEQSILLACGERAGHVRVVERTREARLAQEPSAETLVASELRRQHLERHPPGVRRCPCQVDHAHRPRADHPLDAETRDQRSGPNLRRHPSLRVASRCPELKGRVRRER